MHLIQLYSVRIREKMLPQGGEELRTAWPLIRMFMDQTDTYDKYLKASHEAGCRWLRYLQILQLFIGMQMTGMVYTLTCIHIEHKDKCRLVTNVFGMVDFSSCNRFSQKSTSDHFSLQCHYSEKQNRTSKHLRRECSL